MSNKEAAEYIKQSFELKNQGFFKPAIEMLYKALSLSPENVEILAQLAQLYKDLNNCERSVYYIEKVFELDENHLNCLILLKDIYLESQNFEEAKKIIDKIFEIQPNSFNFSQRIMILNKLNNFDEIKEIENLFSEKGEDSLYELANAYYLNGEATTAVEILEPVNGSKNLKARLLLGKIYYAQGEKQKAREIFTELGKDENCAETLNYLGLFFLEEQRFSNAIDYFSKAFKLEENNAEYAHNLGLAYFLNGWMEEASKNFVKAVCLDSENPDYHYSLAYLYYSIGDYKKSLIELENAAKMHQDFAPAKVLKAMVTAKQGDLFAAKNVLEQLLEEKEDDFAFYALALVYKELLQFKPALEAIQKALELKPDSINYLMEFAEINFEIQEYDEALAALDKILELNEKYVSAYVLRAMIDLNNSDYESLYDDAQAVIELDSSSPKGYYYNALALFEQGDISFAMESLKKSILLDVNNAHLYTKMSELYEKTGDVQQALEWAKEAADIDERNYKYKWLCANLAVKNKNSEDALKYFSQSYRLCSQDNELKRDYSEYLKKIGKDKQAEKISKSIL